MPPAYPVRLPFAPMTRWHGMTMAILLSPIAPPTACADIFGMPCFAASWRAIAPYVVVCPYGICKRSAHTACRNAEPAGCRGGRKSGSLPENKRPASAWSPQGAAFPAPCVQGAACPLRFFAVKVQAGQPECIRRQQQLPQRRVIIAGKHHIRRSHAGNFLPLLQALCPAAAPASGLSSGQGSQNAEMLYAFSGHHCYCSSRGVAVCISRSVRATIALKSSISSA